MVWIINTNKTFFFLQLGTVRLIDWLIDWLLLAETYRPVKAFLSFKLFNFQTFNCDVGHTDDTIKTRLSSNTAHIRVKQNACATFHQLNIKNHYGGHLTIIQRCGLL
jgi:hypothetical protein